jgi:hypothetical protein
MSRSFPSIRELAHVLRSASRPATNLKAATVVLVNDNLRLSLTRLPGAKGCAAFVGVDPGRNARTCFLLDGPSKALRARSAPRKPKRKRNA